MASILTIARRYALALHKVARNEDERTVFNKDLADLAEVFHREPKLETVLVHPGVPIAEKLALLARVFGGKLDETIARFLDVLVDRARIDIFSEIQIVFEKEFNRLRGLHVAHVETAVALDAPLQAELKTTLEAALGGTVEIVSDVDPEVIGGARIRIDEDLLDGRISEFLKHLEVRLASNVLILS